MNLFDLFLDGFQCVAICSAADLHEQVTKGRREDWRVVCLRLCSLLFSGRPGLFDCCCRVIALLVCFHVSLGRSCSLDLVGACIFAILISQESEVSERPTQR